MKKRYVHHYEILDEIHKSEESIKIDIQLLIREEKRIDNLKTLSKYTEENDFIPFSKDEIFYDYDKLDFYSKLLSKNKEPHIIKHKKVIPNSAGALLEDFIEYVNDYKGHKCGIGDYLIQKYLDERS